MLIKDPVCGMEVTPHHIEVVYRGIGYSFCSTQCRDRFQANPGLYVGQPGQIAPKQAGLQVIKRRRLRLEHELSDSQAGIMIAELRAMMGIKSVVIEGNMVEIVYDLLEVTEEQVEEKIAGIGLQLGEAWMDHLRRAFIHYEEECEVGNLEVHEWHSLSNLH